MPRRLVLAFLLPATLGAAPSEPLALELPAGEPSEQWAPAAELVGFRMRPLMASCGARLGADGRLLVRDRDLRLHEAVVVMPHDETGRLDVLTLAASLAQPLSFDVRAEPEPAERPDGPATPRFPEALSGGTADDVREPPARQAQPAPIPSDRAVVSTGVARAELPVPTEPRHQVLVVPLRPGSHARVPVHGARTSPVGVAEPEEPVAVANPSEAESDGEPEGEAVAEEEERDATANVAPDGVAPVAIPSRHSQLAIGVSAGLGMHGATALPDRWAQHRFSAQLIGAIGWMDTRVEIAQIGAVDIAPGAQYRSWTAGALGGPAWTVDGWRFRLAGGLRYNHASFWDPQGRGMMLPSAGVGLEASVDRRLWRWLWLELSAGAHLDNLTTQVNFPYNFQVDIPPFHPVFTSSLALRYPFGGK